MSPRLLRIDEVIARTAVSRSRVYRLVHEGTFPLPRKIGRSARWLADEIDAWIASLTTAPTPKDEPEAA